MILLLCLLLRFCFDWEIICQILEVVFHRLSKYLNFVKKYSAQCVVFSTLFLVFGYLMKQSQLCLIYYMKQFYTLNNCMFYFRILRVHWIYRHSFLVTTLLTYQVSTLWSTGVWIFPSVAVWAYKNSINQLSHKMSFQLS